MKHLHLFFASAALIGLAIFGWGRLRPKKQPSAKQATERMTNSSIRLLDLEVGDRICRPDGRPWSPAAGRTVIIVRTGSCPSCQAVKPFEEKLREKCESLRIPIVYVIPKRADQDRIAGELVALGRTVVRADLESLGVSRVPTMLGIDSHGKILAMWTGTVPPDEEDSVEREITSGRSQPNYLRAEMEELKGAAALGRPYIALAFKKLESHPVLSVKHVVIPDKELAVRAKYELQADVPTFVICGSTDAFRCQDNLITLARLGFTKLYAIGLSKRNEFPSCQD